MSQDLDEVYYQTDFEPPEPTSEGGGDGGFDQFWLKKGRRGIGRFRPNPKIGFVVQRRAHFIPALKHTKPCRPCSTINQWGDACGFFKAAYDASFAKRKLDWEAKARRQLVDGSPDHETVVKDGKKDARASTQYLYNWTGGTFNDKNEIQYVRAYYLSVGYNDAEQRLKSKRQAQEMKCQCNQAGALVQHLRFECRDPECQTKVIWADADRKARRAPGACRECGSTRIPREVVSCSKNCARPIRGNLYACDFIVQKQDDGRLDFDPQPFGPLEEAWDKYEPLDLLAILEKEWVPEDQMLAAAGLPPGGIGPPRRSGTSGGAGGGSGAGAAYTPSDDPCPF